MIKTRDCQSLLTNCTNMYSWAISTWRPKVCHCAFLSFKSFENSGEFGGSHTYYMSTKGTWVRSHQGRVFSRSTQNFYKTFQSRRRGCFWHHPFENFFLGQFWSCWKLEIIISCDRDQYMKGLRVACTVGRCFATTQNLQHLSLIHISEPTRPY